MILLYVLVGVLIFAWFLAYIVHFLMVATEDDTDGFSVGTWKSFTTCYNKRTWHWFDKSMFSDSDDGYIGNSDIIFDNHGMLLDPVSFFIWVVWMDIQRRSNINRRKFCFRHNWK